MSGSISKNWLTSKRTFVDGVERHVHDDTNVFRPEDALSSNPPPLAPPCFVHISINQQVKSFWLPAPPLGSNQDGVTCTNDCETQGTGN
jgi:hypothetical protein